MITIIDFIRSLFTLRVWKFVEHDSKFERDWNAEELIVTRGVLRFLIGAYFTFFLLEGINPEFLPATINLIIIIFMAMIFILLFPLIEIILYKRMDNLNRKLEEIEIRLSLSDFWRIYLCLN